MTRTLEERIKNLEAAVSRMPSTKALVRFMLVVWALLIAALILGITTPAQAQTVCGKRADMVRQLGENYGETRRGNGMAGPRAIVELFASTTPPYTWTILQTTPNGQTCLVASGDLWQIDTGKLTPTGDPV